MLKITKKFYPVILIPDGDSVLIKIPDMQIETRSKDMESAIAAASDAIGFEGVDLEHFGEKIPEPSDKSSITVAPGEILDEAGVDFEYYRKLRDMERAKKEFDALKKSK